LRSKDSRPEDVDLQTARITLGVAFPLIRSRNCHRRRRSFGRQAL